MPLNAKAQALFDSTIKNFIKTMSSQELNALSADKAKLLEALLKPIKASIREQQQQVTALFKTAKNSEDDQRAYAYKTEIEKSESEALIILSCNADELLNRFNAVLNQQRNSAVVELSIFPPVNNIPSETTLGTSLSL